MQVRFKNLLMGYTGKADDSVIYFSPKYGKYLIRRAPIVKETLQNQRFAEIQKRIFGLKPAAAYIEDIRSYLVKYNGLSVNRDKQIVTWNYLYSKLMWAMHRIYKVDLAEIDRADLPDLPCLTIARAVEAGLLPKVKGYEDYRAEM
ncbi:MAG: hypothetical protein FJ042_02085 [Candidatus Cloacimonetes bacterium]|nr:hypothetical protein [Candidatus Cloacimonadota bacterium]